MPIGVLCSPTNQHIHFKFSTIKAIQSKVSDHSCYNGIWIPYNVKGNFLCYLPPAVVDIVLIQLGGEFYKFPDNMHIFIFPKLMMTLWGSIMYKVADIVI